MPPQRLETVANSIGCLQVDFQCLSEIVQSCWNGFESKEKENCRIMNFFPEKHDSSDLTLEAMVI